MADPVTTNYGMTLPTVGGDVGTWGGIVNTNVFAFLDAFLGNVLPVAMSNVDVTLTLSQWQNNGVFRITGTLTANINLILPLSPNSVGSATSVGGKFVVDNQATGSFLVVVKTAATGSTGVIAAQGGRVAMFADGVSGNVLYADDAQRAKVRVLGGNPNGVIAGNAGNALSLAPADVIWDSADQVLYVSNGGTAWISVGQSLPNPQGYLTPTTGVPVIPGDVIGATTIYYTPFRGVLCPIFNGSSFVTFQAVVDLPLALSAAFQLANNIYDVFAFNNAGAMQVGFGPSWLAGAAPGSVTPGSCARGVGAASTAIGRGLGIFVNSNIITLNNGATTFPNIAATQATYLGSVAIDSTNGQVSCFRSYGGGGGGPIRKWGVWNYWNRVPIRMLGGSATVSWQYNLASYRQSNADANNAIMAFTGVAEETVEATFDQLTGINGGGGNGGSQIAIGLNSTTVNALFSGLVNGMPNAESFGLHAEMVTAPLLGLNQLNTLEKAPTGALSTYFGTSSSMLHVVRYNG